MTPLEQKTYDKEMERIGKGVMTLSSEVQELRYAMESIMSRAHYIDHTFMRMRRPLEISMVGIERKYEEERRMKVMKKRIEELYKTIAILMERMLSISMNNINKWSEEVEEE